MDLFDDLPEPPPKNERPVYDHALANYDPPMHERQWYRHQTTGDLAFKVMREGHVCIRYDTPNQDRTVPFREAEWREERTPYPLSEVMIAEACFNADRVICRVIGKHQLSRKEWASLSDNDRILWIKQGPKEPSLREGLYQVIQNYLRQAKV